MACNADNRTVGTTFSVIRGDSRNDDIIAASCLSPVLPLVAVYIAPTASNGAGTVRTKVFEDAYDGTVHRPIKLKLPNVATIHSGDCCAPRSLESLYSNVYDQDPTAYVAPGPTVWSGSSNGSINQGWFSLNSTFHSVAMNVLFCSGL
ncbi:hypothetical protein DFS33DRAFT_1275833 [Desarmillaria ectypa]|nr:hypothetical protein DFS33DRAFT_1275833 [Desarmillaria ectypa]